MIWGTNCVDKGSTKRAQKATRAPRRAFGSIESATRHQKIIGGLPQSQKAESVIGLLILLGVWWLATDRVWRNEGESKDFQLAEALGERLKNKRVKQLKQQKCHGAHFNLFYLI